jgi:hypothetical protein
VESQEKKLKNRFSITEEKMLIKNEFITRTKYDIKHIKDRTK